MHDKQNHGGGYTMVYIGRGKPGTTKYGYALEHRVVMEKHLGRQLKTSEWVHHINGNKKDNRISNLVLTTAHEHLSKYHKTEKGMRSSTESQTKEIVRLRDAGKLVKEICKAVGLSGPSVLKVLRLLPIRCEKCKRDFGNIKGLGMHIRRYHRNGERQFEND